MKKQLKIAVGNGGYAPPRATTHAVEMEMPLLICSADGQAGGAGSAKGVEDLIEGVTIDLNNP